MGFTRPERLALVKIADGPYEGLELTLNMSVSMRAFIDFQSNRFGALSTMDSQEEAMNWWVTDVLKGWNLEEKDGTPVASDLEGFYSLDPALALEILDRWRRQVTEVDVPLVSPSTAGTRSRAPSTPKPARKSRSRSKR